MCRVLAEAQDEASLVERPRTAPYLPSSSVSECLRPYPTSPRTKLNLVLDLLEYWLCMTISSKMRSLTCRDREFFGPFISVCHYVTQVLVQPYLPVEYIACLWGKKGLYNALISSISGHFGEYSVMRCIKLLIIVLCCLSCDVMWNIHPQDI